MERHRFVERIESALEKRAHLAADSETNAWRVVDGDGDGIPGLTIDNFDGHWLAQGTEDAPPAELLGLGLSRSLWWKKLDQKEKDSPLFIEGEQVEMPFVAKEKGLRFLIDFTAGYSQGVFLDQRENRARVRAASREGGTVLNCFSYTCGFSLAAAVGGATATSVDLSGRYLDWGREIFRENDLDPAAHYFSKGDVFEWLQMFAKKGRQFDGIVLDPPTFSRGRQKGGAVFRVENDYGDLVRVARRLLAPGGWMLCCANTRRLAADDFKEIVEGAARLRGESLPMPVDFTGDSYLKSVLV